MKASEKYILYEIYSDNENIDEEALFNAIVHSNEEGSKIYVYISKKLKNERKIQISDYFQDWNILAFREKHIKKGYKGKTLPLTFKVYVKPNVYQEKLLLKSLYSFIDAPRAHQRTLMKFFELQDKVSFRQFPLREITDWIFLTDSNYAGTDQQREFVKIALGTPDFAILEGPPGSGKTTVICELIYQAIKNEQKVLLVASTHVAVDNVIEKLMNENHPNFEKIQSIILPVRIGRSGNVSNSVNRYRSENMWSKTKKDLIERLQEEKNQGTITGAQNDYLEYLQNSESNNRERKLLRHFISNAPLVCGTIYGILQHPLLKSLTRSQTKNLVYPPYDILILDEASKTTFQDFLVPALYAKKYIITGDPRQLSPFVDEEGIGSNLDVFTKSENENTEISINEKLTLNTVLLNFMRIASSADCLIILVDTDKVDSTHKYILEVSKNMKKTLFLSTLKDKFVLGSNIIISDFHQLVRSQDDIPLRTKWFYDTSNFKENNATLSVFSYHVDTLKKLDTFFRRRNLKRPDIKQNQFTNQDENWIEAISWRIIRQYETKTSKNKKYEEDMKVLLHSADSQLVGEIARLALPSIIELLLNGYGQSEWQKKKNIRTTLNLGLPPKILQTRKITLKYQHRMHPEISKFAREQFYDGNALLDDNFLKSDLHQKLGYTSPFVLFHVGKNNIERKKGKKHFDGHQMNINVSEVNEMLNELYRILLQLPDDKKYEIALLTFYKAQFKQIAKQLGKKIKENSKVKLKKVRFNVFHGKNVEITVNVVDKFQGHEADIVLLSIVRERGVGFLDNPNRLNVSVTRAKHLQIIFANKKFLERQKSRSPALFALSKVDSVRRYGGELL